MKYLKTWSSHLKIRDKILIYSIVVSLALMLVFVWASSAYINWTLERNIEKVTETNVEKVRDYLENVEYTVNLSLFNIRSSITVRDYLLGNDEAKNSVWGIIHDVANRECISVLELYDMEGKLCLSSGPEAEPEKGRLPEKLMEELNGQPDRNYWSAQPLDKRVSVEMQVFRSIQYEDRIIGYVRVRISDTALTDIFNYVGFNVSSEMCVFGDNEKLILPKKIDAVYYLAVKKAFKAYADSGAEEANYNYADGKYRINCTQLKEYGVIVVIVTRTADMQAELSMIQNMIYLLGGICLILLVLVSVVLSNVVSTPLIQLTREVEQAGWDNLDLKVNVESYNEIGTLSRAFNQMLERARILMAEVEKAQRRKRELELRILQVQITPHFLYNSLESLSALSLIGDNETVYQMSKALGIFYRDVLSEGWDVIPIKKEIDIVQNYLLVQSIRYQDKFTFSIQIDPKIESFQIVKLTLQPLVENAIYHGIREINYPGRLEVTGGLEEGCVVLRVRDNGKGIPKALQDLEARRETEQIHGDLILHRKGFGMSNVDERLKLYFGSEYGLRIYSGPGQGTCIEVHLPAVKEERGGRR